MDLRWAEFKRLNRLTGAHWGWLAIIVLVGIGLTSGAVWRLGWIGGSVVGAVAVLLAVVLALDVTEQALAAERKAQEERREKDREGREGARRS